MKLLHCDNDSRLKSFVMTLSLSVIILISAKAQECVTSPVITCPMTYFGCGSDDITPEAIGFATALPGDTSCPDPIIMYEDEIETDSLCSTEKVIKRTWLADYPGNTNPWLIASCTQVIVLSDNEAPVIADCPADITLSPGIGCEVIATWVPPTASDDCGIASFTSNISPGATLEPGVTTVIYTAEDNCGKTTTCSFTITVEDVCCDGLPMIEIPGFFVGCPSSSTDPLVTGMASAVGTGSGTVSCTTPFLTFEDASINSDPCMVQIERVWTATNVHFPDLTASGSQTITLEDVEAPVLSACPDDITVSADASCRQTVSWTAPTATDNCGLESIVSSVGSNSAVFDIGQHIVTYTATDSCGLQSSCSFSVIVEGVDLVLTCPPPFFGCPGTSIQPSTTGTATLATNIGCDVDITYNDVDVSQNGCSGSREIDRTWTAIRAVDGATTSCVQRISLQDNQAPVINNCPADIRVLAEPNCLATVSWAPPTASDNCAIASFSSNFGSNSGVFELGQHTITYTAVDNCGNLTTCSFLVIVEGGCCTDDVVLSCPPAFTGCPGSSMDPSVTGQATSSGTADCPVDITFTDAEVSSGPCTGETVINRTWVATRVSDGQSLSCVQRISLIDDEDPILTNCPTGITVTADNGCEATVTWTVPTATDDCGLASLVSSVGSNSSVFTVGSHTVTYTATDNCGNETTCSFSVTVLGQAPSISCPPAFEGCPGSTVDPAVTGMATTSNDCTTNISFTDRTVSRLACTDSRIIERTWVATNTSDGASVTCVQTISMVDNRAPVINNCPSDIRVTADASCSANVSWTPPTASDNCGIRSFSNSFGANSGNFGVGTHTITYTAIDNCGQISKCSFLIIVEGGCCTQNLSINCPADFTACPGSPYDPGVAGSPTSSGTTECPVDITFADTDQSTGPCTGERVILRRWTATRAADGQTVECTQRITLIDTQGPAITNCPADIVITANSTCQATVSWTAPTASDDCGLQSLVSSTGSESGVFDVGTHTVIYTATDNCGNTTTCSFSIVVSGPALSITCPADFTGCPGDSTDPAVIGSATSSGSNACSVDISFTDVIASTGSCDGVMVVNRTWVAYRPSDGTTTSCIQKITLIDTAPPVISNCPSDIRVTADASCSANVSWTPPTASDDCGLASFGSNTGSNSGVFTVGQHTISYTAVDNCGQITTCSFLIIVEGGCCTQNITINCPADYTACPGSDMSPAVTGQATSTGTTECPVDITFSDTEVSSGPCTGERIVDRTWLATRVSDGQSASCVQRISLIDNNGPSISNCPADIVVSAGSNCQATVSWTAPSATDNCGLQSLVSSTGSNSGVFGTGTHTVTYTATDNCGNMATCSFTVTVTGAGMSIACPATFVGCPGSSTDPAITGMATASGSGDCGVDVTFTDVVVANGACSGVQEIDRTWLATRTSDGATTSCVQRIRLIDSAPPVITGCPSDITVTADASCQATVSWTAPTATDDCGLASFGVNTGGNSGVFAVGQHTITYTAIDNCGNVTTCNFLITVEGACCTNDVVINCPPAYSSCPGTSTDPSITGMATSTGTADCPVNVTFSDAQVSQGSCTGTVEIDRTWVATRASDGVSSSCVQRITLIDNQAPTISGCPANITVTADASCQATVSWAAPTGADNCGLASLVSSTGSNSGVFGVGSHTVTYTATDNCGLMTTCSFIVTVEGGCCTADVAISCPATYEGCPGSSIDPSVTGMATSTSSASCNIDITFTDNTISSGSACTTSQVIDRTWVATRVSDGASTSCVQRISLIDNIAPVIMTCVPDVTLSFEERTYSWANPPVQDACGNISFSYSTPPGTTFSEGITSVNVTVTDGCGNTAVCTFSVTVGPEGGDTGSGTGGMGGSGGTGSGLLITCSEDIVLECGSSHSGAIPLPDVSTDCDLCQDGDIPGFVFMGERDGKRYYCSKERLVWPEARAFCEASGGQLAIINDAGENAFLAQTLQANSAYIGLSDEVQEGVFKWVDGSPLTYKRWFPHQPNNYNNFQDYVELLRNGYWNDQTNNKPLEFIMEVACLNITQTAGPTDLSQVTDNTTVSFRVEDACGNIQSCSYNITTVDRDVTLTCPDDIDITTSNSSEVVYFDTPEFMTCCNQCNLGASIPGFVYMGTRNGSYYYCSKEKSTWPEANAISKGLGGNLAIIGDSGENYFLAKLLVNQVAFIGISDHAEEGVWRDVNGNRQQYFSWRSGNPNNFQGVQHYAELEPSGTWNDNSGTYLREFIMEIKGCNRVRQIAGPVSGSSFSQGSTTVTFQGSDGCGNVETCSFDVNIRSSTNNQASYCASGGTISSRAFIKTVQFNRTLFKSGDNGGYVNVKSPCISLQEGSTFDLKITPGFGAFKFQAHYGMWIDYNGDGDFDDSGEFVARALSSNPVAGSIRVPYNTVRGATRMRIALSLTGYPVACGSFVYGETEDYCVVIRGSSGSSSGKTTGKQEVIPQANFRDLPSLEPSQFSVYPNPASDVVYLADGLEITRLRIYGLDGRIVREYDNPDHRLDVSDLHEGVYLMRMIDREGLEMTEKLIKQ